MELDLHVRSLGDPRFVSPLDRHHPAIPEKLRYLTDENRVLFDIEIGPGKHVSGLSFEKAGARERIFFDPAHTRAAIVTCGGLCPGINDVVRALVLELHYWYGVSDVLGVRYGYGGLAADPPAPPIALGPEEVADIHIKGGTLLGSSRGHPPVPEIVDSLVSRGVNLLFCIGGDGTLRGAHEIATQAMDRGLELAVVGIPKTIDNDIGLVYRSFGFQTAIDEARKVLDCAHVEAKGVRGGIGLVKLMGRHAGFIAAHATCANGDVNYCLIPETPLVLDGERGLLAHLRDRLRRRRHAVIAVAEGAGQDLIGNSGQTDASGNVLNSDIGLYLKQRIEQAFREWGEEAHIKYFDPSYIIRSVPANSSDSIFCADLARRAVHAAMAGKTDLLIGYWHGVFTHVPLSTTTQHKRKIELTQSLWLSVLNTTGQPYQWG